MMSLKTNELIGTITLASDKILIRQEHEKTQILVMSPGLEKNIRSYFVSGQQVLLEFYDDGSVKAVVAKSE